VRKERREVRVFAKKNSQGDQLGPEERKKGNSNVETAGD